MRLKKGYGHARGAILKYAHLYLHSVAVFQYYTIKYTHFVVVRHIGADCNNHLFQSFFLFFVRNGAVCGAKKLF